MSNLNRSRPVWFFCAAMAILVTCEPGALAFESEARGIAYFEKNIRPLFSEHCYKCHSSETKQKGGLVLDSRDGWVRGGDSGEAIVQGDANASPLIHAIRYTDSDFQMPPKYQLSDAEIEALETWINGGAPDPRRGDGVPVSESSVDLEEGREFWAFREPSREVLEQGLDSLVAAGLRKEGLNPNSPAGREVLIRRATFDLTGLPPAVEEIDAFLTDPADDREAFATVVDRLLASPQFGERWGRHWLDVVRFGESVGRTRNYPYPFAWKFRNYVIDAFNNDLPFDEFLTEQLAGDLLDSSSEGERDRRVIATGFLALGSFDLNERNQKKFKMDLVDEQIDVTGRAFMALTTGCARCHDHKFDPIPTRDYYALAGIFASTDTKMGYGTRQGGNRGDLFKPEQYVALTPVKAAPSEAVEDSQTDSKEIQQAEKRLGRLQKQLRQLQQANRNRGKGKAKKNKDKNNQRLAELRRQVKRQNQQLAKLRKGRKPLPADLAMGVCESDKIADCKVNLRGDVSKLGEQVPRGFLQVVSTSETVSIPEEASGRLELARWLTAPSHPLTARVFVNRIWHHLFGHGIVRTVDNFGETGNRPSNQPLLDHLALRFQSHDWSVKKMIREIMLSHTYRMSSTFDEKNFSIDPDNDHFWRVDVQRLEVEAIRDALLALSGDLDLTRPDSSPLMKMQLNELRRLNPGEFSAKNPTRSVYLPVVRGYVPEVLEVFDFAEPSQVIGRRDVTTVSPQALFFMNSPFVLDQSAKAAARISENVGDATERVIALYRGTLGRKPTPAEIERALEYLKGDDEKSAWARLQQVLFASAEFRYLR